MSHTSINIYTLPLIVKLVSYISHFVTTAFPSDSVFASLFLETVLLLAGNDTCNISHFASMSSIDGNEAPT